MQCFAAASASGLRSGLSLHPLPDDPGLRCRPSSLYTFPAYVSPGLARDCHFKEVSPTLSGSTSPVSRRALKFFSSPLRLPFRHARVAGLTTVSMIGQVCLNLHAGLVIRHQRRSPGLRTGSFPRFVIVLVGAHHLDPGSVKPGLDVRSIFGSSRLWCGSSWRSGACRHLPSGAGKARYSGTAAEKQTLYYKDSEVDVRKRLRSTPIWRRVISRVA
jgi:hypothetical protein